MTNHLAKNHKISDLFRHLQVGQTECRKRRIWVGRVKLYISALRLEDGEFIGEKWFTALQIAGEEIKNQSTIQSQSLNLLTVKADALLSINTETRNIADDTRDLIAQSYLELVQISENTGAIVKPIQQMQRDIAEVKRNTAKL